MSLISSAPRNNPAQSRGLQLPAEHAGLRQEQSRNIFLPHRSHLRRGHAAVRAQLLQLLARKLQLQQLSVQQYKQQPRLLTVPRSVHQPKHANDSA